MHRDRHGEVTVLLEQARTGDAGARSELIALVYDELRGVAGALLRRERTDHTLQPSALVNEALMRLIQTDGLTRVRDSGHLFAAAAQAMRQVLVDHARRRKAAKRAGTWSRVALDDVLASFEARGLDVLALDEAIDRLFALNRRHALVVLLRFFAGLSIAEVAEALDVSAGTVEGDWRLARAWLRGELGEATA